MHVCPSFAVDSSKFFENESHTNQSIAKNGLVGLHRQPDKVVLYHRAPIRLSPPIGVATRPKTALRRTTDFAHRAIDRGEATMLVALDISLAFDIVVHSTSSMPSSTLPKRQFWN